MKFVLIDKIVSIEAGNQITAVKNLSLAEEYLADHFPIFPVLPGVLLLEGLIESGSWLVRKNQDFANSMVLLKEAKNVKYKSFAAPGMQIRYSVTAKKIEQDVSSFTGEGTVDGKSIVQAKFTLRHFNLADKNPKMASVDSKVIESMKQRFELLKR
jgi:3-hydroxyacyl-[acyl-carrier-protein] dehydratase